ncbi:ion transporter [Aequorivita sp. H23M31]|uniref:Ion transporter n=2 Tax=Aequorivita ciconiae TaxID=2494375 RepID=A0A410G774_9FLAO|nr:ion transporter [Aequorivita sp. H23M31]
MGKLFDIVLLILILVSVLIVMLESVTAINSKYHQYFLVIEWVITILFTIEYITRIIVVQKPAKYIFSFYGIIDFLSTIPLYISLIFFGTNYLITIRALRLLRIFRILKIGRFIGEGNQLRKALMESRVKIFIFIFAVIIIAVIFGTLMYLVEGEESGFENIPVSIYWTIVTLTTVGFGDIAPITAVGQFLATLIMILGYGIIAVPTGIVGARYFKNSKEDFVHVNSQSCQNCGVSKHRDDAKYCYNCGENLYPNNSSNQ